MTYTVEDFNQYCHEAAGQFLQTVVVIDNEAVFCDEPCNFFAQIGAVPAIVEKPPTGVLGERKVSRQEKVELPDTPPAALVMDENEAAESPKDLKNILKATPLINAFADKGVMCSIIRPDLGDDEVVQRAITLGSVADIVVVDWALGKKEGETEGQKAKEIIKGIIEGDLQKSGRLRLITIYTAERNPDYILDQLYEYIEDIDYPDAIIKDSQTYTIQNRFLKIVVLLKKTVGEYVPNVKPIDFDELPKKLHELFAELNHGLLPSVTLRAIAAIRESTHHLLAVLHKDLDSALVGHRCLLPYPEDAEEFCEDLVAGEIRSILALAKIGTQYVGKAQNELWVSSRLGPDGSLNYGDFKATPEQISTLLSTEGEGRHKTFISLVKDEWAASNNRKADEAPTFKACIIPQLLHGAGEGGIKANHEFARLTSFKREAFGLRKPTMDWVPKLTLGTVLQRVEDGRMFLCLQPRCESVRLEKNEKRVFPFLEMEKGKKKECIVVNTINTEQSPEEKILFFEPKPKNQAIFEFTSVSGHAITADKDNKFYIFSADKTKFYWLGDLKDPFAQNIVGKMSDVVGSVGIDPYEWQRRQGK